MTSKRLGAWLAIASSTFLIGSMLSACGSDSSDAGLGGSGGSGNTDGGGATGGTGGAAGQAGMGGQGGADQTCGNGKVEGTEKCDDGNLDSGDGCENTCDFTCSAGDTKCDDGNPCNGDESCGGDHKCVAGTPLSDGTSCGTDSFCVNGNCVPATCGDGQTQSGEECDDGDTDDTNGCTTACKFSCLSTDPTRDCTATGDECAGSNKCDDTAHTCTGGTPKADNDPCNGGAGYCASGVCTTAQCGNSKTEPGEDCDDGNTDDTDGCTQQCKFTCTAGTQCSDGNTCTQDVCSNAHVCSNPADTSKNGQACTGGSGAGTCQNGSCVPASCGDGNVTGSEQCDKGNQNGVPGSGCTSGCTYECNGNTDCTDNNPCTGTETCATVTGGKTCKAGTPLAKGAVCQANPRSICDANGGQCKLSICGDTIVDTGGGEQCEPPNTATCDANCKTIAAAVCGNGTLETGEQCDDGNTKNLDGCDSKCKYEVVHRLHQASIMGGTGPSFCSHTKNQLGNVALTNTALGQLNPQLQSGIDDGSTNVLIQSLNLDDLTGTSDSSMQLGIMTGILDPAKGTWPATGNPIDWWFKVDQSTVDANLLPTGIMTNGSIAAKLLTAGPSDVFLTLLLGGSPAVLQMRNAKVRGNITGTPNKPAPPPTNLTSGLVVFPEVWADGSNQGLCGDITVDSLSKIPIPEALTTGVGACSNNCSGSHSYTYCGQGNPVGPNCNSLLDALVGGCRAFLCITAINATQPDVPSGSAVKSLSVQGSLHKVPLADTNGNLDAYSSYIRFRARRAHATGVN
ncbi:MAG: hypothetical protein H6717_37425 [Polyangiaceae bacterium]|nr:hypothetical protein [Polyangiaceae bacterium]